MKLHRINSWLFPLSSIHWRVEKWNHKPLGKTCWRLRQKKIVLLVPTFISVEHFFDNSIFLLRCCCWVGIRLLLCSLHSFCLHFSSSFSSSGQNQNASTERNRKKTFHKDIKKVTRNSLKKCLLLIILCSFFFDGFNVYKFIFLDALCFAVCKIVRLHLR